LCETARDIYEALGAKANATTLAHIYTGISYSLESLRRHADAAIAIDKAAAIYSEIGSTEVLNALRAEGDSWFNAKEYEKAFQTYKRAIDNPNPDFTESDLATMHGNSGWALQKMKRWDEAISFWKQARELHKKAREPQNVAHCDEELSLCYFWLGNGMEAEHHARKAMDFAVTAEDDFHLMWAYARMALAKKALEDFDVALDYFAKAKSIMVHSDNPPWRAIYKLENQVASIYVIKGQVSESDAIMARIETLREVVFDDDEVIDA
jgi:tetratricopeptide (TPR) repeat protein